MKEGHQVMPPLSEDEFQGLKGDIGEHGVLVPVVVDGEGRIIDGHHRVRAWEELKAEGRNLPDIPVEAQQDLETEDQKRDFAWKLNMQRRHLTQMQKREVIADKLTQSPEWANNRVAQLLGVHSATVGDVRRHLEATSQIEKLPRMVGQDNKWRPRSRSQGSDGPFTRRQIPVSTSISDTPERNPTSYSVTITKPIEAWRKSAKESETRPRVEGAKRRISELRSEILHAEPEAIARLSLNPEQVEKEKRQARELIEWFGRYVAALEDPDKLGARPAK